MVAKSEFLKYLDERVGHYEAEYAVTRGKAFTIWYGVDALGLDDDAAYEASQADGGNDKGIDFFHVDEEHERVIVLQGKFRKRGDYKPKVGELYELLHSVDWLSDPEALRREGRNDLASYAEEYLEARNADWTTEFHFVYVGPFDRETAAVAEQHNTKAAGAAPPSLCRVVSIEALLAAHRERVEATRIPEADLGLKGREWFRSAGSFGKSLVASAPGTELKRLYGVYGESLFDRNIRLFLGTRQGGVNAGIRDTLQSPRDRKNFWAYNNGITIVCDTFALDEDNGVVKLTNFSIVNGCQTTTSLGKATDAAAKDAALVVRVIQSVDSTIDEIIRYNNSQTPIRIWEFSSQDPLQRSLKEKLAEDPNPFLYVLRKGETRTLTDAERSRFRRDGSLRQIQHDLLTQYLASFDGYPTVAYKDKARLFGTMRSRIYPESIRVEKVILVWQLGQIAEQLVRDEIRQAAQDEDDVKARILRRGAKMFVVAVAGEILRKRNGKTFLTKLKREVATSKSTEQRLRKYARLGITWYVQAVRDAISGGSDLGTLVKSEDSFEEILKKVVTNWDTYSMSEDWVKGALPKL